MISIKVCTVFGSSTSTQDSFNFTYDSNDSTFLVRETGCTLLHNGQKLFVHGLSSIRLFDSLHPLFRFKWPSLRLLSTFLDKFSILSLEYLRIITLSETCGIK